MTLIKYLMKENQAKEKRLIHMTGRREAFFISFHRVNVQRLTSDVDDQSVSLRCSIDVVQFQR